MRMQKTICMLVLLVTSSMVVAGQTRQFTRDGIEYDLPPAHGELILVVDQRDQRYRPVAAW